MTRARPHPYWLFAVVIALAGVYCAMAFSGRGVTAEGLLEVTRSTGRTSVFFFLAAFDAGPLHRRRPSRLTRWLVASRRQIGLAFALSHFIHLAALASYLGLSGEERGAGSLSIGALAYVFITAMALTSNDASQRLLGPRWRTLHLVGSGALVLVFSFSYFSRVATMREPLWLFASIAVLIVASVALRIADARAPVRASRATQG
jgi:methionine sulfoxide reductase heme-binding subunit